MTRLADGRWAIAAAAFSAIPGGVLGAGLVEPYAIAASAFLAATMGAIAFEDLRRLRVPDVWNVPAALAGFAFVLLEAHWQGSAAFAAIGRAALSMVVCGGVFFLLREIFFRVRGVEGLGFGDVKLAATGGIWLGWDLFPVATAIAAIIAIGWVAIAATLNRSWPREQKIPFAAFLAPAIWLGWFYLRMGGF